MTDEEKVEIIRKVGRGELLTRFRWLCPNTKESIAYATELQMLPDKLYCSGCKCDHYFHVDDIEVEYEPRTKQGDD